VGAKLPIDETFNEIIVRAVKQTQAELAELVIKETINTTGAALNLVHGLEKVFWKRVLDVAEGIEKTSHKIKIELQKRDI
jgi:hypothetical protein